MINEYWLQKKTIGGWSQVTWYVDIEQAKLNYNKCVGNGNSGYSWRLVKVEVIEASMLEEVVEVEAPEIEQKPLKQVSAIKYTGWSVANPPAGEFKSDGCPVTAEKPSNSTGIDAWGTAPPPEHGLSGSVWLVHHGLKKKTRVAASEVAAMMEQGYVKGSPRTVFK